MAKSKRTVMFNRQTPFQFVSAAPATARSTALARTGPSAAARVAKVRSEMAEKMSAFKARIRQGAVNQRHKLVAGGVAGLLGFVEGWRPDVLEPISLGPVSPAGTLGLLGLVGMEVMGVKNAYVDAGVTGLLCCGLRDVGQMIGRKVAGGGGGTEGMDTSDPDGGDSEVLFD